MVSISQYIPIIFLAAVYVLRYTVVVIYDYKCMHVVLEYKYMHL